MSLKDTWKDKQDLGDIIYAEDINDIAHQAIKNSEDLENKADKKEILVVNSISGSEIDGDMLNFPSYIYDGSLANWHQDFGADGDSPYENVPFNSALIFTLSRAQGGIVLGDNPYTQIAVSDGLIWTRVVSTVEYQPIYQQWKRLIGTAEGEGSLSGEGIEVDTELMEGSFNPIANDAVFKAFKNIHNTLGDINGALVRIIEIQESLIGGTDND